MRKLAVIGTLAAGILGTVSSAGAAPTSTLIGGSMANNVNTCIQIVNLLVTGADCSYAATRYPVTGDSLWKGPVFASGFYPFGSAADGNLAYVSSPGDGKLAIPLSGSVTIEDGGTPGNGADDTISATFEFGAAVNNVGTGQLNDSAVERWDAYIHTLAATPVDAATAQPGGGYEYVIGVRGMPTPQPGPLAGTSTNTGTFPSETALNFNPTNLPLVWEVTGATALPRSQRIGIERSEGYGNFNNTGAGLAPNLGAQTTATFINYQCQDDADNPQTATTPGDPDSDCSGSATLLGSGQSLFLNEDGSRVLGDDTYQPANPGDPPLGNCNDGIDNDGDTFIDAADTTPVAPGNYPGGCSPLTDPDSGGRRRPISPPGFDNLLLRVVTDATNRVTQAEAYWTREWVITNGNSVGNDDNAGPPAEKWKTPNSWIGGYFSFKGCSPTGPIAVADSFDAVEGTANGQLLVASNDNLSCAEPNTITVANGGVTAQGGTAVPSGTTILYTAPPNFYDGPDSFTYTITDDDDEQSSALVNLTVTVKAPTASTQSGSSSGGAAVTRTVLTTTNAGSGTVAQHTVNPGAGTLGTCTASGADLTFTPTASGGNGSGGCAYTITDVDGDESNSANFIVNVTGNSSGGGGGGGPQLPGGGSLDALTLGALLAGIPLVARRRRRR